MSFTPINAGDPVSETLEIVLLELKTALNERETCLGLTLTTGWSTDTQVLVRAKDYIDRIRAAIPDLIPEFGPRFVRASDLSEYADVDDLLDEAGYPDGWISTAGMIVSDRSIWIQIQEVFGSLVAHAKTGFVSSNVFYGKHGTDSSVNETAWDNSRAASPEENMISVAGTVGWNSAHSSGSGLYSWRIYGDDHNVSFGTGDWLESELGEFISVEVGVSCFNDGAAGGSSIDFDLSGNGFSLSEGGDDADKFFTLDSGFVFGVDFSVTLSRSTADPVTAPWTPPSGNSKNISASISGTPKTFHFDITPVLTYG